MNFIEVVRLILDILVALATIPASILAIFGDRLKNHLFRPRLQITKSNNELELTIQNNGTKAFYFHESVSNIGNKPADETVCYLKSVVTNTSNDKNEWVGEIPFTWVHEASLGKSTYTILENDSHDFDLFYINEKSIVVFEVKTFPNNLKYRFYGAFESVITVCAKCDTVKSNDTVITINWDGIWDENSEEMKKHVCITIK